MTVDQQIRAIAAKYAAVLETRVQDRVAEMVSDDKSHFLIYRVLGVSVEEGEAIDIYQNKGRFLYRYAGTFLEHATKICLDTKFPGVEPMRIPNTIGSRPKTFEIDCLIDNQAYEIKWRDARTDGDHITKEHTRIRAVAGAGFVPIRLMYYYPNRTQAMRIQAALEDLYKANGGAYYYGDAAWEHLEALTDINLLTILEEIATENSK
ncbi:MAG: ApaLI family restriction endonuclease [Chloroflexi bacterium]|nr:ApaLI family restriction endonuclease [Chloroflexota bacterium]